MVEKIVISILLCYIPLIMNEQLQNHLNVEEYLAQFARKNHWFWEGVAGHHTFSVLHSTQTHTDFEFLNAYTQSPDKKMNAIRVGNIVITTDIDLIHPTLQVVYTRELSDEVTDPTFNMYNGVCIAALSEVSVENQVLIDFGAGSGTMSKIALVKGAVSAILIERNKAFKQFIDAQYRNKIQFIPKDFRAFTDADGKLIAGGQIGVVNIGPQPFYGGQKGAQLQVYNLIQKYCPDMHTVILGGFGRNDESLSPKFILEQYQKIGFHETSRCQYYPLLSPRPATFQAITLKR